MHGDYGEYTEDGLTITGDYNTVRGGACTVTGDYNKIYGDGCTVTGDHNTIYSSHCHVYGDYNHRGDTTSKPPDRGSVRTIISGGKIVDDTNVIAKSTASESKLVFRGHSLDMPRDFINHMKLEGTKVVLDGETYYNTDTPHLGYWPNRYREPSKLELKEKEVEALKGLVRQMVAAAPAKTPAAPAKEPAAPPPAPTTDDDRGMCSFCMVKRACVMYANCLHLCFCEGCDGTVGEDYPCPICRGVGSRVTVHLT